MVVQRYDDASHTDNETTQAKKKDRRQMIRAFPTEVDYIFMHIAYSYSEAMCILKNKK